jgi:hypothetical protein
LTKTNIVEWTGKIQADYYYYHDDNNNGNHDQDPNYVSDICLCLPQNVPLLSSKMDEHRRSRYFTPTYTEESTFFFANSQVTKRLSYK